MIWGYYPERMRGRIRTTLHHPVKLARPLVALKHAAPLPDQVLIGALCSFHEVGPSTATKLLFTAEIDSDEGRCLIYDEKVVRGIALLTDEPGFRD